METREKARSDTNAHDLPRKGRCQAPPERITFLLDVDGSIQQIEAPSDDGVGVLSDHERDAMVATSLFHHIHEHDLLPVFRGVAELVTGERDEVPLGFRLHTAGGMWRAVQGTARLCGDGRTIAGLMLTLQVLASLG